tara:strand:- start:2 stop:325 length:324 start_codon:yes stop_codon:yes gene_type:complete
MGRFVMHRVGVLVNLEKLGIKQQARKISIQPEDFVIAPSELNCLEKFVAAIFSQLDLNWKDHVEQSHEFMRPTDLISGLGNASKAKKILGWKAKYKIHDVVGMMMKS